MHERTRNLLSRIEADKRAYAFNLRVEAKINHLRGMESNASTQETQAKNAIQIADDIKEILKQ